ncbi:MAG: cation:proton antiporter [Actinomycetota bacterium]|nr:cation:proton antiporter [Actinomycetota bacterium]
MSFGPLALLVAAGLLGPLLAAPRRLAPPVVVGQIAAGVIIGVTGFGWIDPTDPLLTGLANIGFALLMFVVGTHLPVRDRRLRASLARGAAITASVLILAAVVARFVGPLVGLDRPGLLTVLLATSSCAIALPVLQGLGGEDRSTLVVTAWIACADVATVVALPAVLATGSMGSVLLGLSLVVAAGAVLFAVARLLRDRGWVHRLRSLSHDRGWGLDLRVSLLALFGCAWLAARYGTSIMIAGFTVGVVVALLGEPRRVADQLVGVGEGFAIPLYFVYLGTQLDLGALVRSSQAMKLAGVLAVGAIGIHLVAGVVWRLPLGAGLLAAAQLGVPAAMVSIGLSTGQLTPAQSAAIMAAVLATLGACAVGGAVLGHRGPLTDASAPQLPAPS